MLELDSLRRAVKALGEVLEKSEDSGFMAGLDDIARNAVKSGVIQHFEFTYELCWKFMKRWLEVNVSATAVDGVTRRELFRHAAEQHLINDVEQWMRYHDARNRTAHTYELRVAEEVYSIVHGFMPDAMKLLQELEKRND